MGRSRASSLSWAIVYVAFVRNADAVRREAWGRLRIQGWASRRARGRGDAALDTRWRYVRPDAPPDSRHQVK